MTQERKSLWSIARRAGRRSQRPLAILCWCAAIAYSNLAAGQQAPTSLYAAGDAAVTGFSGALPPIQIAPGVDPNTLTFVDANGPSLHVVDLRHMGGPPEAQLVGAEAAHGERGADWTGVWRSAR